MLRTITVRQLGAVAAGGSAALLGAYLYNRERPIKVKTCAGRDALLTPKLLPTFEFKRSDEIYGVQTEKRFNYILLDNVETEKILHKNEITKIVDRPGNPVIKWDSNILPTLAATQDRFAIDLVQKDNLDQLARDAGKRSFWDQWLEIRASMLPADQEELKSGGRAGDLMFVSVFDGHGESAAVSELLRKVLHPALACTLGPSGSDAKPNDLSIFTTSPLNSVETTKTAISDMIKETYLAVDADILNIPFSLLTQTTLNTSSLLPFKATDPLLAEVETSGSCALTAIIDVENDKLCVANVGDGRAVAGWWNPEKRMWRCDILTEDQMGDNPGEAARIRSEHPPGEYNTAIYDKGDGCRVLGSCQPTRAFGDSRNKRTTEDAEWVGKAMQLDISVPNRPKYTPPYTDAKPNVVWRELHPNNGEELRFLIIATDGLWDRMTSEEAALLVSAHLAHPEHSDVPKSILPSAFPYVLPSEPRPYPAQPLPGSTINKVKGTGGWTCTDENAATHLIRNSLSGADRMLGQYMLSAVEPGSRGLRDDITAIVVFFGESG